MSIEVRTYSIFKLKYLHDKSEVFILSNRINKRQIGEQLTNKVLKEYKASMENKEFIVLRVVMSRVQEL